MVMQGTGALRVISVLFLAAIFQPSAFAQELKYLWPHNSRESIEARVEVPAGYVRVPVQPGSFQDWLRHLPLKPGRPEVLLYNGKPRWKQDAHFAVIDIDVPRSDLQQCADSIIRLAAEYLYSIKDYSSIHFNFTSGHEARFDKYAQGYRPVVAGNYVRWLKSAGADDSYQSLCGYLIWVFRYAGTYSLNKELAAVANIEDLEIGDVLIKGGFPGHAMIVVDAAQNPRTKKKIFLLAQGYNPAVEMHVVINPNDRKLSPWYSTEFGNTLETAQYDFRKDQLKRFSALGVRPHGVRPEWH